VALHAIAVVVRLVEVNFLKGLLGGQGRIAPQVIFPDVLHAVELGRRITEHAVIGVADITVLIAEVGVAPVTGCQRFTFGIAGIGNMPLHHVAGAAKFAFLGCAQTVRRTGSRGDRGQNTQAEQQPKLTSEVDCRAFPDVMHQYGNGHGGADDGNGTNQRRHGVRSWVQTCYARIEPTVTVWSRQVTQSQLAMKSHVEKWG